MLIVGLTGGIASGKSTVSAIFKDAGALVIDADVIAHQVIAKGLPAWRAITSQFGRQVLGPDGAIDRDVLGALVFKDQKARKQLEAIVHPQVRIRIDHELNRLRRSCAQGVVVLDIPLLLETGMTEGLSEIIVVYTPKEIQLKRLMIRDRIGLDAALARIDAQMSMLDKRRHASIVIDNSGDPAATKVQALKIYENLSARAK